MQALAPVVASCGLARPSRRAAVTPAAKLTRVSRRQQLPVCMSAGEPGPAGEQQPAAAPPAEPAAAAPPKEKYVDPEVARGQRTAIITGAISIIFGVLYLALVQFMDSRGGEMLPPPPEAFEYM